MKRILWVLVPLALLAGLISWRFQKKDIEAAAQAKQRQPRAKAPSVVTVATAEVRDIVQSLEASGTVEAPTNATLSAKSPARIEYLSVREGDPVRVGQVLIRLDSSDVDADVRRQQALVAEARSRLAQAIITQDPAIANVESVIREREADLAVTEADRDQVFENSAARRAQSKSAVDEAQGRISDSDAAITSADASLRGAQASLTNAMARLNRLLDLYRQGFIAAQDVDDAKTTVAVQEQAIEVAKSRQTSAHAMRASMVAQRDAAQRQYEIGQVTTVANKKVAEAKVLQARAALASARANAAQKPAYKQNIAAMKAAVDAAEASLRLAVARREDAVIASPMDGTVTMRHLDPGTMATPGQPILSLQTSDHVWIAFPISEPSTSVVRVGMRALVSLDALPDRAIEARIAHIHPSADPATRQFLVRASLVNPPAMLKPGMFARVTVETARKNRAVVVPQEAIQHGSKGEEVVIVVDGKVARRTTVRTGAADTKGVSVTGGVSPGDKVVIMSAGALKDGAALRVASE